jgi:hypothetical protein
MGLLAKGLPKKDSKNATELVYHPALAEWKCRIERDLDSKRLLVSAVLTMPIAEDYQMTALEWCNAMNDKSLA